MKITSALLKRAGACSYERKAFRAKYPKGLEATQANFIRVAAGKRNPFRFRGGLGCGPSLDS